jgi:predicted acetyltransferase
VIALAQIDADDARLGRLLQLYMHEWSEFVPSTIGPDALYTYDELASYRDCEAGAAYLFLDGDLPLGFALIAPFTSGGWGVEEFFVVAGARRRSVGRDAAAALFATRPGRWTLTIRPENLRARTFWRSILPDADECVEVGDDGVGRTRLSFVR